MVQEILVLVRRYGDERFRRFTYIPKRLPAALGGDPDVATCLLDKDPDVSRFHASIDVRDGVLFVRDEESRTGTLVDGKALAPGEWVPVGAADGTHEIRIQDWGVRVLSDDNDPSPECESEGDGADGDDPVPSSPQLSETAQGQLDLSSASVLPIEGPWPELKALGFLPGRPINDDPRFNGSQIIYGDPRCPGGPIFRRVAFPKGWRIVAARRGYIHSYVLDERDVRRVSVYWDATFYNRQAACFLCNAGRLLAIEIVGDEALPIALPPEWPKFTHEERESFEQEIVRLMEASSEQSTGRARALFGLIAAERTP